MRADTLLAILAEKQIEVWVQDGKLKFRAPAGSVTDDIRHVLCLNRAHLIERLSGQPSASDMKVSKKCINCRHQDWVDESPQDGRIRTHCGKCGRFIGYRPVGV